MNTFFEKALEEILVIAQRPERQKEYDEWEKQAKEQRLSRLFDSSGVPLIYQSKTLANFRVYDWNREAYSRCKDLVLNWDKKKESLAIFGSVGAGKTHLGAAVVNGLIQNYEIPAKFANILHILEITRMSFSMELKNPLPALLECPFLVMDDIGSERPTAWVLEMISHIIDHRVSNGFPVLITSNAMNLKGLMAILHSGDTGCEITIARIMDRIRSITREPVLVNGKSQR